MTENDIREDDKKLGRVGFEKELRRGRYYEKRIGSTRGDRKTL